MMVFGMRLIAEVRMALLVHKDLLDQRDQQELLGQLAQQGHKDLRVRAVDSTAGM